MSSNDDINSGGRMNKVFVLVYGFVNGFAET